MAHSVHQRWDTHRGGKGVTSWLQTFRIDGLPRRARVRTESRLPLTSVCVDATIILPPPPGPLSSSSPFSYRKGRSSGRKGSREILCDRAHDWLSMLKLLAPKSQFTENPDRNTVGGARNQVIKWTLPFGHHLRSTRATIQNTTERRIIP